MADNNLMVKIGEQVYFGKTNEENLDNFTEADIIAQKLTLVTTEGCYAKETHLECFEVKQVEIGLYDGWGELICGADVDNLIQLKEKEEWEKQRDSLLEELKFYREMYHQCQKEMTDLIK